MTVPPGFSEGVSSIHISADGSSNEPQDPIGVSELLFSDDNALLTWADDTSTKKPAAQIEEAEKPIKVRKCIFIQCQSGIDPSELTKSLSIYSHIHFFKASRLVLFW